MRMLTVDSVRLVAVPRLINRVVALHRIPIIGLALAASLLPTRVAVAIPVLIDLGPTGVVNGPRTVDLPAPNVQFQSQSIGIDFSFENGQFIRLFTATKSFQMDAFFRINNAPLPPPLDFSGSGFLTDSQGGEIGPSITLQANPVTGVNDQVGVDFLLRPLTSNALPADIYGIHLELTLPDSPGFGFGSGPVGAVTFSSNIFGIGPGVPRDIVPDLASTFLLLTLALVALIVARTVWLPRAQRSDCV